MQDTIKINGIEIFQPDEDLGFSFETTYTSDSTRVQSGVLHSTPMFTVEQLSYQATDIPVDKARELLQFVVKGVVFKLHYYSFYHGAWRDDDFYVGKGQYNIGSLSENKEKLTSISFNMTGVNPI